MENIHLILKTAAVPPGALAGASAKNTCSEF
jgi:hypothetical protein